MTETRKDIYDAIVIGSGITGGLAAKELTEKGLRVLMLERHSPLDHPGEYKGEHAQNWELPYGGYPDRELNARDYDVQSNCYAFDAATRDHFIKDSDEPYIKEGDTDFQWYRGGRFGGRSVIWGRQVYRWGPQNFEENAGDGHGTDWPIRYEDLAPWYAHVEKFIGVSGKAEGLTTFPDMVLQKPMPLFALEKRIKKRLARHAPELTYTIGRTAILTEDKGERLACHYCGPCPRGCSTGSYFSTQSASLPAALKTGRLTIAADTAAQKIIYDAETNRASGVQTLNTKTLKTKTYEARIIFLCASTINSAQILLNSRSAAFPKGLANRSGVVGRYLMDHNSQLSGIGIFTDDLNKYYRGHRPNGSYIPRFRNVDLYENEQTDFLRGYGIQCNVVRLDYRTNMHKRGLGAKYKDSLRKPGMWVFALSAFGEFLPRFDNRISLDESQRDKFGLPVVKINIHRSDNELKMTADMFKQGDRILKAAGAAFIVQEPVDKAIDAIHEMGTVRMGKDRKTSALNGWNQAHDVPNLFVTDGAAMASSGDVNPSLTYMALTARAADYAAGLWKRGEL